MTFFFLGRKLSFTVYLYQGQLLRFPRRGGGRCHLGPAQLSPRPRGGCTPLGMGCWCSAQARSTNTYRNEPKEVGMVPRASFSPLLLRSPLVPLPPRWERLWLEDAMVLTELFHSDHGAEVQGSKPKPHLQTPPRSQGPRSKTSQGDAGRGRPLTRIRQSRAHQAQQLPLLLVVALTEELPLLQHKLVALLQAPLADAAAEAAQVVDALLGAHHQLAGRDGLQAPGALHREEPGGARGDPVLGTRDGEMGMGAGSPCHPAGALITLRGWAQRCWHPGGTQHVLQACPVPGEDAAFGSASAFLIDLLSGAHHECHQRTKQSLTGQGVTVLD